MPLVLTGGAGSETRMAIGWVILGGVSLGTVLTLWVVPCLYRLLAKGTSSPDARKEQLATEIKDWPDAQ